MELKVGKRLFEKPTGGSLDLSWYFLIFGCLAISIWGFFALRNKEFIGYLLNFTGCKSAFWGIILARIILIVLFLIIAFLVYWLQYIINGMGPGPDEITGLLTFFLMTALLWVFLLGISAACGAVKSWKKGAAVLGVLWILLVLIWPEVLSVIISNTAAANMKSAYKHEIRKIEKLMQFEKEAFEYSGRYKTREEKIEADKRMGERWWDKDFQEIEKLEAEMFEKTREIARNFHFWSIFNPVTHYKSVNNELSSRGYNAYMEFAGENQKIQKGFLRYYLDKKRYESYTKVVPYLSKEQLVSHSKVSLPAYFVPGLILNLAIICGVLFIAYFRFNRFLFPLPQKDIKLDGLEYNLANGKHYRLIIHCPNLKNQLLNVFYGRIKNFTGKVTMDGENAVTPEKKDIVYIPNVCRIPGAIKVRTFFSLVKGFDAAGLDVDKNKTLARLTHMERLKLLFSLAGVKNSRVYILDDYVDGLDYDIKVIRELVLPIKEAGKIVIELASLPHTILEPDTVVYHYRDESGYCQRTPEA
jgi:ABC-type transport system involved in multi-copper enzyme maturation permease subunit